MPIPHKILRRDAVSGVRVSRVSFHNLATGYIVKVGGIIMYSGVDLRG